MPRTHDAANDAASGAGSVVRIGTGQVALLPRPALRTVPRSRAELEAVRRECRAMVLRSAGISGVAAVVPIPAADIGVDVSLFLRLIPAINDRFGLSPQQLQGLDERTKELVFVSVTSVGSQAIGKVVTAELVMGLLRRIGVRVTLKSAAKWVPFIGQAAAATISFGAMRLVGNRHVEDCYRVALSVLEERERVIDVARPALDPLAG